MKILIYDLETAPTKARVWKAWKENISPAQVIDHGRVICWAAKWKGEKKIHFGAEWDKASFIEDLHTLMQEADAIITYNGDNFDEKVLNTEFMRLGLHKPPPRKSIDMYKVVKKNFRLFHYRMDSVARELGLQGKVETGGIDLWIDVDNGDPKAQKKMERYNRQDIKVLEAIYEKLSGWIVSHPAGSEHTNGVCPNCRGSDLQRRGYHRTKVSKFQRYQCTGCGSWHRGTTNLLSKEDKPEIITL